MQSERSLRKIMLVAQIVGEAGGGSRLGDSGCAGALCSYAICALDQGAS